MSNQHPSPPVRVETMGSTLVVTLDRPEARNAVNREVADLVAAAMQRLDESDELRAGVITGAGSGFCSGMDLKAFVAGELPLHPDRGFAGITHRPPVKPLIAAVEGFALAGGFEIVLACDLVVTGRGAWFGIPEVTRGLVAGAGGLLRLPRRLPRNVAMELGLLGQRMGAGRMAELGLVNRLVEDGQALATALEIAGAIADNGPLAVLATKRIVAESLDWNQQDQWREQDRIALPVTTSEDAREGARAFAQKRRPVWQGR